MKWESLYTRGNKVPANAVEPLFQVLMQHGELELKERRAPWLAARGGSFHRSVTASPRARNSGTGRSGQ